MGSSLSPGDLWVPGKKRSGPSHLAAPAPGGWLLRAVRRNFASQPLPVLAEHDRYVPCKREASTVRQRVALLATRCRIPV